MWIVSKKKSKFGCKEQQEYICYSVNKNVEYIEYMPQLDIISLLQSSSCYLSVFVLLYFVTNIYFQEYPLIEIEKQMDSQICERHTTEKYQYCFYDV